MNLPLVYRATSSLLIKASRDNTVSIDSVYSLDTSREDYFLTQFEILKSRAITEKVIDELKLALHPEFLPSEKNLVVTQVKNYIQNLENAKKMSEDDWAFIYDSDLGRRRPIYLGKY